ncbi:hypothetical protein KSP40_PGU008014 [Platanthera guangdongensis]|uniref:Uncharacterized protein n=1 Tax=Platanthera guangdongensis TaxID=2320717 RepID=A0ABR2M8R2_9ASPA
MKAELAMQYPKFQRPIRLTSTTTFLFRQSAIGYRLSYLSRSDFLSPNTNYFELLVAKIGSVVKCKCFFGILLFLKNLALMRAQFACKRAKLAREHQVRAQPTLIRAKWFTSKHLKQLDYISICICMERNKEQWHMGLLLFKPEELRPCSNHYFEDGFRQRMVGSHRQEVPGLASHRRTAGPPVVMNPISRQNFIVKSPESS